MSSHPVESYLKDLAEIYRTGGGVAEESYYGALEDLLSEIRRKLEPDRRCADAGLVQFGGLTLQ